MNRPNITIRSNVFVRNGQPLANDKNFVAQIRGRNALLRCLKQLHPNGDLLVTARKFLSRKQLAEVAWQSSCSSCGAFPEGAVSRNGSLEVQFRCPRNTCAAKEYLPRTVTLSLEVIRACATKFSEPITEIVQNALRLESVTRSNGSTPSRGHRAPVAIRLTLAQRYFLSDEDIEAALWKHLGTGDPL